MADGGTPFQAEAAVCSDQGLSGDIGAHAAIAQDEVWQDGAHRLACGALKAPDGETAQTHACIMGVAGGTNTHRTKGLVGRAGAGRQRERQDKIEKKVDDAQPMKKGWNWTQN